MNNSVVVSTERTGIDARGFTTHVRGNFMGMVVKLRQTQNVHWSRTRNHQI